MALPGRGSNDLFETKHVVLFFVDRLRPVRIGVPWVKELHNMEATFVDVEVDVSLLEVGGGRLPEPDHRVALFDRAPRSVAQSLPLRGFIEEEEAEASSRSVLV